jgi:hypothetical protein
MFAQKKCIIQVLIHLLLPIAEAKFMGCPHLKPPDQMDQGIGAGHGIHHRGHLLFIIHIYAHQLQAAKCLGGQFRFQFIHTCLTAVGEGHTSGTSFQNQPGHGFP